MKVKRCVETTATPERVWHFLVNPDTIPVWCTPAKKLRLTGETAFGLGTTFYFEEKASGQHLKLNLKVTEWALHQAVTFKMTSGNFVKGYQQTYTLEPAPAGSRFTLSEDITLPWGVLGQIAGFFVKFRSEIRVKNMLFALKDMAEA